METNDGLTAFQRSGRCWFRGALTNRELAALRESADPDTHPGARLAPQDGIVNALSGWSGVGRIVKTFGARLVPVRIVAFNKTRDNNWGIPWHQDRVISVQARHDLPDFVNWSRKGGVWHCEPPREILAAMLFLRVHLDETGPEDGAMRIAVGSHAAGIVPSATSRSVAETYPIEECHARPGDVLVLNMLTLHASPPSSTMNARRVLRVDYAPMDLLPPPLAWQEPEAL